MNTNTKQSEYGPSIKCSAFEAVIVSSVLMTEADLEIKARRMNAGVMVRSYHDRYMAQGGGCADTIDFAMKQAFMTKSREVQTKKGIRAEPALDTVELRLWGIAIGLWNPAWEIRNGGMQRMNLANRVRSRVRKGETIELKGVVLTA